MPSKLKNNKPKTPPRAAVDKNKVMLTVSSVVGFMKEQVVQDLMAVNSNNETSLNNEELRKLCFYVESSMTNSFIKASNQIELSLK